jgi:hypothetical protein
LFQPIFLKHLADGRILSHNMDERTKMPELQGGVMDAIYRNRLSLTVGESGGKAPTTKRQERKRK